MSSAQRHDLISRKLQRQSRQRRRRKVWAALTSALLTVPLVSAVFAPTIAAANPNPDIVVSDVVLTKEEGGPLTVGDVLVVSGSWDASQADPEAGDTFTIGLPAELGFQQTFPFNLEGGDGTVWAECLTDATTHVATCTLTGEVTERPEEVQGTFRFEVEAVKVTTAEEVEFLLNGNPVMVELPGDGGIGDGIELPTEAKKSGRLLANKWSMRWTIELPGADLAAHDAVTIFDDLSGNHELCSAPDLVVETVRGSDATPVTEIASIDTTTDDPFDFAITLTPGSDGFDPNVTYRISYTTCTPDKQIDEKGAEYTNDATLDIWFDDEGQPGIGVGGSVTQDWEFGANISKSGGVRGGSDRNGVIDWTVTISGAHLAGNNSFTLTEELSGEHALCLDGDDNHVVRGLRIDERYGPSETLVQVLGTEILTPEVKNASEQAFEIEFKIVDSDFAFKDSSNYLYRIRYQTCATTDGLPTGGTEFVNKVEVDGAIATGSAKVPGRTQGKSGNLNSSTVTLDGVDYFPQTTLGWAITVPGEMIEPIDSEVTLTDVLTDNHQVCGVGDDITARLGLSVRAQDQISGGGLTTVDLTDTVSASVTGSELSLTIPPPTDLPAPGGGTVDGFSPEYQYLIHYMTCTTSGGMDAPGTKYENEVKVAGQTWKSSTEQRNSGSGTGTGVTRGSVAIKKLLDEDAAGADFVADDTVFTVHVKEFAPGSDDPIDEYDLEVPLNGGFINGKNPRGNGWTIELSEPTFPDVPGVTFGEPVFSGDDVTNENGVATVPLTPGSNIEVVVTNTTELGSLEVIKEIGGEAADRVDGDEEFHITAKIDVSELGDQVPPQEDREFTISENESFTLDNLPIGATVSFSETQPEDGGQVVWGAVSIDPGSIVVTPDHASETGIVTVLNQAYWAPGTFSIAKEVTGALLENPDVPDTVEVTASWLDAEEVEQSKQLQLPTDGTPVDFGQYLPYLTEVTLTETPLDDAASFTWDDPIWSGDHVTDGADNSAVVTIAAGEEVTVSLTNNANALLGSLNLTKNLAGSGADLTPANTEFPVIATWTDLLGNEQSAEVNLKAGKVTTIDNLPIGTEVLLTEQEADLPDTVRWKDVAWESEDETVSLQSQDGNEQVLIVVTGEGGIDVAISLTNTMGDVTPASDWLPRTGAEILTAVGIGLLFILAGVGLYRVRRNESRG